MPNLLQLGLQVVKDLAGKTPAAASATATAPASPVAMVPGQPITVTDPQLTIQGMQPGTYTFELVVTDDLGASSAPVRITVQVTQPPPQ